MRFLPISNSRQATVAEAFPEVFGPTALPSQAPEGDPVFQPGLRLRNRPILDIEPPRQFEARIAEDRRKQCRRVLQCPVLLDTRAGNDRRKEARRQDDGVNHIADRA